MNRNTFSPKPPDSSCPCRRIFAVPFRPDDGCVFSGDLSLVKDVNLRKLISYGPKFRLQSADQPLTCLEQSLDSFISKLCSRNKGVDNTQFLAWKTELLREAKLRLDKISHIEQSMFVKELSLLKKLQRVLTLVPADKAANNTIFVCKRLYCHVLRTETQRSDGAYHSVPESAESIVESHTLALTRFGLTTDSNLPFLFWLPKMHKSPPSHRFISAAGICSTRLASAVLSKLLACVHSTIRKLNDEILVRTGVRRYFVIQDANEAAVFLSRWPRLKATTASEYRGLHTFDFSTMYTNIPLKDLCDKVDRVIDEAAAHLGETKYEWMLEVDIWGRNVSQAKWTESKQTSYKKRSKIFSVPDLKALMSFVVFNTFVCNRDSVLNQHLGIPMGTNSAPELANLYLYFYESSYIDKLILADHALARSFHLSFRLLDDLLSADNSQNDVFTTCWEDGGVYPKSLMCGLTSKSSEIVQFCGLTVTARPAGFDISVYDKRSVFPFHVRNYPHSDSNIPRSILYSAFVGQLHRFYRLSSTLDAFRSCVKDICRKLVKENGCRSSILSHKLRSFITRMKWKYPTKRSRFLASLQTDIRDFQDDSCPHPDSHFASQDLSDCTQPKSSQPKHSECAQPKSSRPKPSQSQDKGQSTKKKQGSRYDLSLSYLDDPKAWLRDEDIANICHEIYKDFIRQPWTGFQNLDWFCHYPIPADLIPIKFDRVRDIFISDKLPWSRLLISESVMFVPLNLGRSHWTLLALDSRPSSRCVVFWDPLGYRCPNELRYKLTNFFIGFTWTDVQSRIQHDGFQCGVWVCWAVETFTSLALDGKDWNRATLRDAFDNTLAANGLVNTLSNVRHNSSYISTLLRQKFINCIYLASAQQSLSVDYVVP